MQRPRLRFTLRTMMITVAVAAVAFALMSACCDHSPSIDPFDSIEMIGVSPKPSKAWKGDERGKGEERVFPDPFDSIEMIGVSPKPSKA